MQDILMELAKQLNSSVFVLLALLVLAFWGAFKVGSMKEVFLSHARRMDKIETMADTLVSLKTMVDLIYRQVNPNIPVRAQSPAALTKVGEEIASAINAEALFRKYAVKLAAEVSALNPQNAYDIQQASFSVARKTLQELLDEKELNLIKDAAYNKGILVEDVLDIFGILLRNKILHEKGIPVAEVDKHARR